MADLERLYDVHWEIVGNLGDLKSFSVTEQHVLYQLCGHHSLYGPSQLLYIGRSEEIQHRLESHSKSWAAGESDVVHVRAATVGVFSTWEQWVADKRPRYDQRIDVRLVAAIEILLIYAHQPAYNSQSLATAPDPLDGVHLRIFNTGKYAPLLPEVSTRRYRDVRRPT
ncbi:MAG: hypothetical protein IPK82_20465 [Polyangiaceae bacterium]|nr:hypothetical protein [Polyangiaceae bacterium]